MILPTAVTYPAVTKLPPMTLPVALTTAALTVLLAEMLLPTTVPTALILVPALTFPVTLTFVPV